MAVIDITSFEQWDAAVRGSAAAVAFFWADWHEPSKRGGQMDAVFTHLAQLHPQATFLKVEAEAVPEVSVRYDISVVPTFMLLQGGPRAFDRVEGVHPQELSTKVQALLSSTPASSSMPTTSTDKSSSSTAAAPASTENLNERLKKLINAAPVVLFMKGSPSEPRCGFSNKIISILKEEGINFASFDILSDEEVRQGLKKYSDWPTYPQLYVKGELIGGLDIVTEMRQQPDSLKTQLGIQDLPTSAGPAMVDLSAPPADKSKGAGALSDNLQDRLKALTTRAPIMLFMKGNPSEPRCGFSNKIVSILKEEGFQFDSFDILSDEEVRQGLKVFSDWPTFPQLYVDGELIGGLDIVNEMRANGELQALKR